MRFAFRCGLVLLMLAPISSAENPPDAPSTSRANSAVTTSDPLNGYAAFALTPVSQARPEARLVDRKFLTLAIISTGSTFADSYTTLFARDNWLAGKHGVCNMEVESAYLYGTHPTVIRSYAVASAKSVGTLLGAYYLRRHHSRFWSLPLIATSMMSLQGVGQNLANCN